MMTTMDDTTQARARWFHLTPVRFVTALLAVEVLLWLSERFGWLGWHKGYAVLTGVAVVGVAMLLMLVWFAVALVFRRRFQFSIRSLLVLIVVVAIPCSWLAVEMRKAREQREVVEAIKEAGGRARYDYQPSELDSGIIESVEPPGPPWLRNLLGEGFLNNVVESRLNDDAKMQLLKRLPQLKRLLLDDTRITDAGLAHLVGLNQLQVLRLRSTRITDAGLAHFAGMVQLQVLSLDGTKITDVGLAHLAGLNQLQVLSLENTRIMDAGLAHLAGLTRLEALWLDGTEITDEGLAQLAGLSQLQVLSLGSTPITGAGLAHLAGLNQLQALGLDHTQTTDAGLGHLAALSQLDMLLLTNTQVTDAGVAKLHQALPNCKIIR